MARKTPKRVSSKKKSPPKTLRKLDSTRQHDALLHLYRLRKGFDALVRAAVRISADLQSIDRVSVWLFTPDRSAIQCVALYSREKKKYFQGDVLLASKYKPYFKALNSGRSLLAKNAHKDPRTSAFTEDYLLPNGIGAMMDVPIWQDGRVIGVLCHEHVGGSRRWARREEEFANAVADCITGSKHAEERRQAEIRYHALLEASDDMVFIEDYYRNVLYINPAVEKHTGYTATDYDFNVHQHPLIYPEDLPNVNRFIADFIQSEAMFSKTLENRFVDRWGRLRWHSSVLSKIEYLQKPAIQFVVSDITGQKFALDALHRSEERFTMLVRQLRDLITIVAADGTIRYESPSIFPMLGYTQDELLGRNAFDQIHPEDLEVLQKTFESLLRAPGESATAMYRFLHKNGTWRHCESVGVNLLLDASVEGILITTRDVTERVEAEQLLKEREERYRKLVESFHDILFITDFKRNMLYINPAMERLTGYTLNDFRFPPDDNPFVHPEDFNRVNAFIDEFAQSTRTHSGIIENRFFDRWGTMHWYSSVISKIEYDDQPCLQFICRDISDVRRSEEALTQSDQKYRAFIEQSTEGIYRLELDEPVPIDWPPEEQVATIFAGGYIAEANTAQALMYGFNSVDDLIGLRLKTLLLPEDPHNVAYMVDFVKSGYRFANQESHEIDKYGVQKIFLNSAIGIVENGKLMRVWGTQKDITEFKKSEIALKQSEERYRAFVTNSSEGICLFEFETPIAMNLPVEDQIAFFFKTAFISECNSTYALSEGYRTPDQLTGSKVWRDEDTEQTTQRDWVAYLIRNGYSASDIESEKVSKDGSKRFFINSYTGVVEQGFWKRVWAVRKDVTERRLVEEDLRNNEANLAAILENSHDSIWSIDAAYRIVTINSTFREAYYAAFGIRLEVGMNVMDSIPDDLKALWKARYERVIVRGQVFMESDHYDLGGESRDYEISFFPIRTDDGIIRGASIFSRDVTERVRSREAVERREKYYRALIENALDLISIISADGTILYESPSVEKITGFTPNDLIGKNVLDFAHPEDRPLIREAFQTGIHQGQKIVNVHFRFLHKDHSWRTLEVTAHNLLHDAVVGGIVVNSRDITERKKSEEVLRQSEEKFRLLAENLPGVVYMCENDADFTFIYTSEAILDITGYPKEDFYDRRISLSTMYHPDDVAMINHIVHTAVRDQHSFSLTYRIRHRNGSWRWLSEVGSGVYADGKLLYIEGFISDITELRTAESILRQRDLQYKTLVEQALNPVYVLQNEKIVVVNPAWEKLFGYTAHDVSQPDFSIYKIIAPENKPMIEERMERRRQGLPVSDLYELKVITKDGRIRDLEVRVAEILWNDTPAIQGVYYDITDRKKTERALEAEKERLSVTLRSIGDGVITTDVQGRIVLINRVAEVLTGWTQEEAQDRPIEDVFHIINYKTKVRIAEPVRRIIQSGGIFELEQNTALIARDGTERLIADSGAPIRDKESTIIGVVLVFRDITEKQKIEEERLKSIKLESVGLLAGGIAHDFNNILTAILGNISLARMEHQLHHYDKIDDILSRSEKAGFRAKELTQQLLTFAKGGSPVRKTLTISELIREAADFMMRGSNVLCEYDMPEDLWPAEIDEGQISQVIQNLVINAVHAMPDGGVIRIKTENVYLDENAVMHLAAGKYIRMDIADHGVGIAPEYLSKIFDPYFTTKQRGSGLGLATCYSIVKNHQGAISVVSQPGTGSVFTVYLPASEKQVQQQSAPQKELGMGSGKILVMDDEEDIREITTRILRKFGYQTDSVTDGTDAIRAYTAARDAGVPYDVVIMDLTIPGGMGGKETIKKLLEIDPNVRAVVSSGYSNDPIMADHKSYGFKGYIIKPFQVDAFRQLIHDVINDKNE